MILLLTPKNTRVCTWGSNYNPSLAEEMVFLSTRRLPSSLNGQIASKKFLHETRTAYNSPQMVENKQKPGCFFSTVARLPRAIFLWLLVKTSRAFHCNCSQFCSLQFVFEAYQSNLWSRSILYLVYKKLSSSIVKQHKHLGILTQRRFIVMAVFR